MRNEFDDRIEIGKDAQDILIDFLERHYGYKFEAGERFGEILNTDLIEELENCEFIPPNGKRGARLIFKKNKEKYCLTMPDVFMSRNSTDSFYWIEAKKHTKYDDRLVVDSENFDDYKTLYENFTRQKFNVMCLTPEDNFGSNFWDVYWCDIGELINFQHKKTTMNNNSVYVWEMYKVMKKLNKYPIDIYLYNKR